MISVVILHLIEIFFKSFYWLSQPRSSDLYSLRKHIDSVLYPCLFLFFELTEDIFAHITRQARQHFPETSPVAGSAEKRPKRPVVVPEIRLAALAINGELVPTSARKWLKGLCLVFSLNVAKSFMIRKRIYRLLS